MKRNTKADICVPLHKYPHMLIHDTVLNGPKNRVLRVRTVLFLNAELYPIVIFYILFALYTCVSVDNAVI